MKKVFNCLLIILVLLGMTGCENPIDPSMGGSNAFLDVGVELTIKKVEGANWCEVYRSKGNEDYCFYMTIDNYENIASKKTVIDYFVNPGETYKYKINYYNTPNGTISKEFEKTADVGVGELCSVTKPSATYDENTGKMTFNILPKFPDAINTFIENSTNCEGSFNLCYWHDGYGNVLYIGNIKEVIDCPKHMNDNTEQYYGKSLTINEFDARVYINGVSYNKTLQKDELGIMPETIVVPDTRKTVEFDTTFNDRVLIKVPNEARNAERVEITRNIKVTDKDNKWHYENSESINIYDFKNKNINVIPDYFVEQNKEYYYTVVYSDDNWNKLYETKPTKIVPTSGHGEIQSETTPAATYIQGTGIMTFSVLPEFSSYINDLVSKPTSGSWNNYKYLKICYNRPNWGRVINTEIEKETDMSAAIDNEENFNKELNLVGINAQLRINDIEYSTTKIIPGLPDKINVPDTRVNISVKQVENGIEITLPTTVPSKAKEFTIGRVNVNHPSDNYDMKNFYINCDDLKKNVITDYFVKPGETYEYTLYYRHKTPSDNRKVLKKSKPINIKVAKGLGEGFIKPGTKVNYNESTGIMSLNPIPDYSVIKKIMTENDKYNASLVYRTSNWDNIWASIKEDGTINWSEELSNSNNGSYFGKPLTLNGFNMEVNLAGVRYQQWINKEDLKKIVPTIRESITVPDNRAELKLTPTADRIIITLPKDLKGATECNIQRRRAGSDDWYNINASALNNKEIIDYFVDNGVEYEYSANFSKYLGDGKGWETVLQTKISSVKATGGKGDIEITNTPLSAEYKSDTSEMTFNPVPTITQTVAEFLQTNNYMSDLRIAYGIKHPDGWWENIFEFIISNSMILSDQMPKWATDYYGKKLILKGIKGTVKINDVTYIKEFNVDTTKLPKTIVVSDKRAELTLTPTADGIEIAFPAGVERAKSVYITRYSSADNFSKEDENIEIWDLDKKEIKKITDYFVESGKEYKYIAVFRGDNWDDVVLQTKLTPVTAKNGCTGELKSTTTPTATYDPGTGIMNFSTKPVWPTSVSELVSNKSTVTNWENYSRFIIVYNLPNWGRVVNTEILNTINLFADVWNMEEVIGKELTLSGINAEVQINGIKYSKLLPGTGLTEKVTVVDTRPEITLASDANGIIINLPEATPAGAQYFTIGRQNVNRPTDSGDMLYWYIRPEDLTKKSVVDYFVTPGQKYEYTVYYRTNNNGNIIGKSKSVQFTAENGMNESFLDPSTTVSYNNDTGIMTLSTVPDTSKINGLLKEGDSFEPKLWYRLQDNSNSIWGKPDINGKIDWVSQVGIYENGKYLKTNLELQNFQIEANISNVKYKSRLSRDDLNIIFPTIPTSIFVPDTRAQLKLTPITDGIEIEFPKELQEASSCTIYRRLAGSDSNWDYIDIPKEIFSSKIQEGIIDYFVCSNKKYEYYAIFKKFIGGDKGWEPVLRTKTSIVNADNGKGEIEIINSPKADYNQTTAMMNFTELPQLTSTVMDFITTNNYHSELKIVYQKEKSNFNWDNFFEFQIGKSINLSEIVSGIEDEICNQNLTLSGIEGSVYINGVLYYKEFITKTSGLPAEIVIPDNRTTLTLTPTTDGIKIDFPKDLKNATSCTIFRRLAGSNSNWDMIFIKQNFSNKTGIIDKFVENGKNYEYYATFHKYNTGNIGTEIVLNTKISSTGAAGGRGEIGLNNPTELNGSYDNNGIMKLDPIPCIKPTLVNNESWKFGIGYTNPSGQWQCAFMDNETGIIDYKTSYNKDSSKSHVGKKLKISSIRIIVDTGDLHYQIENFPNVSLANLPQEIFVTEENLIQ